MRDMFWLNPKRICRRRLCLPVLFLYTIVSSSGLVSSDRQECSSWEPENEKWQDQICYLHGNESLAVTDGFSCSEQKDPVSWKLLDTPGSLEVEFPFIQHRHTIDGYIATLYVDDTIKMPQQCQESRHLDIKHSEKFYGVVKCDSGAAEECSPPCGKTIKMLFRYVFSGCYRLGVEAFNEALGTLGVQSMSCPQFMATEYTMEELWKFQPLISPALRPQLRNVAIAIALNYAHRLSLKFSSVAEGLPCHKHSREHSCCYYVPHDGITCRTNNGNLTPTCTREQNTVTCTFHNVSAGHYCFNVEIIDDERCETNTIWTSGDRMVCKWSMDFDYPEAQHNETIIVIPPERDTPVQHYVTYIAVVVTLVLFLIIVGLTYLWYARRVRKQLSLRRQAHCMNHLDQHPFVLPQNPNEKTKILLLYARDCSPFMKLMASFSLVLQHVANCEVLDCFDPMLAEEVSSSPVEWVRCQVTSPAVKVVVVATECAAVRQKAHIDGATTAYKSPTCFDDLFLYGLKSITDNIQDGYNKCYLVRFDKFTDDNNLLSYLTPQRRFVLPIHLGDLISYLNQVESFEPDNKLVSQWEVQQLRESLTNLVNYKVENEDYLRELIMVP